MFNYLSKLGQLVNLTPLQKEIYPFNLMHFQFKWDNRMGPNTERVKCKAMKFMGRTECFK